MKDNKDIHDLKLHEITSISPAEHFINVLRVDGGFIYFNSCFSEFVPYEQNKQRRYYTEEEIILMMGQK